MIQSIENNEHKILIYLKSKSNFSHCPLCGMKSQHVHSTYIRKPLDASILSKPVQLKIQAKKFFCLNSNCKRQIFTERFTGFLNTYRRLTVRLEEVFLQLSLSMSAEALSRFLFKLGYERSGDSLLDLLRRIDSTEKEIKNQSLTHIGVDDFSFRRGVEFGTVICDLKTHRPVEILASRSTQAFKEWLEKHPSVKLVTRDRATTYTKAIHSTNPDIIQIADKWHFLKNLLDVVKETISSRFPKGWFIIPECPVLETTDNETDIATTNEESTVSHESLSEKEQSKWTLILEVQKVYQQLGSIRQTARHLKLSRTSVTKYIQVSEPPKQIRKPRVNQFLPYLNQITQWCQEGKTAIWIHKQLIQQGFKGAPSSTRRKVQEIKATLSIKKNKKVEDKINKKPPKYLKATKFQLISLIWRKATSLTQQELDLLNQLFQGHSDLSELYTAVQLFRDLVTMGQVVKLSQWLERYVNHEIKLLREFCRRMKRDEQSIINALVYPYTNAICEGNVNRIKMIKRQMYGRGSFKLLRIKVLYA